MFSLKNNSLINLDYVDDGEFLFRAIHPNTPATIFIKEDGSPSSAILKDSHGVSVDRDGKRSDKDVMSFFCKVQKDLGNTKVYSKFLKMPTRAVRESECDAHPDPTKSNPYHALVLQNGDVKIKSKSIRKIINQSIVLDNPL